MKSLHETASPELERSTALINQGCKEIQKLLEVEPGKQPSVSNLRAVTYFMPSLLEARQASDLADYERVERVLSWVRLEVGA